MTIPPVQLLVRVNPCDIIGVKGGATYLNKARVIETFHSLKQEEREGFTIDANGNPYDGKVGYAVGWKICPSIEALVEHLDDSLFVGWWKTPDGVEHIDLVQIFEAKATALLAAFCRNESSIYDFSTDTVIYCRSYFSNDKNTVNQACSES